MNRSKPNNLTDEKPPNRLASFSVNISCVPLLNPLPKIGCITYFLSFLHIVQFTPFFSEHTINDRHIPTFCKRYSKSWCIHKGNKFSRFDKKRFSGTKDYNENWCQSSIFHCIILYKFCTHLESCSFSKQSKLTPNDIHSYIPSLVFPNQWGMAGTYFGNSS